MNIIDDYKQLQMIENVKKIKEMELCYKANLKLCKQQEKQINKLATCIEEIKDITSKNLQTGLCSNCDGVGLYEGCEDTSCSYYQMNKILQKCEEIRK